MLPKLSLNFIVSLASTRYNVLLASLSIVEIAKTAVKMECLIPMAGSAAVDVEVWVNGREQVDEF